MRVCAKFHLVVAVRELSWVYTAKKSKIQKMASIE